MSDIPASPGVPPMPSPHRLPRLGCAFVLSLLLNLIGALLVLLLCFVLLYRSNGDRLTEKVAAGKSSAHDKVAIIALNGILLEGLLDYAHKQIDQAAGDPSVKAVVVRINSPGGSITASEDLYRKLVELRAGNPKKGHAPRPLIVSMGSLAASGGYYIAVPAQTIFAERTTLTGSIGVFMSLPNVKKLAEDHGVFVTTIKQGQIKDSGSPFAQMNDLERQVWQDMIDAAYQRFVAVIETNRSMLAGGKLLEPVTLKPVQAGPDFLKKRDLPKTYQRYLADGGVWTAENAKKYNLIDNIGTLDDAVQEAHDAALLGENYQVIRYEHPRTLMNLLGFRLQSETPPAGSVLDPARLEAGFTPRVWYLTPGAEASGFFAAMRE